MTYICSNSNIQAYAYTGEDLEVSTLKRWRSDGWTAYTVSNYFTSKVSQIQYFASPKSLRLRVFHTALAKGGSMMLSPYSGMLLAVRRITRVPAGSTPFAQLVSMESVNSF